MINMEIPDPFANFVARKERRSKGFIYDWFAGEWSMNCGCCGQLICAPTKKTIIRTRLYHTRNECLNGY